MQTETKRCTGRTACGTGILKPAMIVAFLMMAASALAQDVIVTVTKVKQTLPPSVAEIIDHPNRVVSITLQNTTPQQMKVYLKLSLTSDYAPEGVPLSLHTEDRSTRRPCITLGPNEMRRLTNITDISDHFSGRLTTNVTENVMNIMRIPEGMYSMCLEVYPWRETVVDDGAPMSRDCAQYTVCYSASAPELITPIMVVNDNVSSVRQLQGTSKNSKVTSKTNIGISTINNRSTLPERSNPNSNMVEPSRLINIRWTGAMVPNLYGLSFASNAELADYLEEYEFTLGSVTEEESENPKGTIVSQSPSAQTEVSKGTAISVVIAKEITSVEVPSFNGKTLAEAQEEASAKGLQVSLGEIKVDPTGAGIPGTVMGQSVAAGDRVPPGTVITVDIIKEPDEQPDPSPSEEDDGKENEGGEDNETEPEPDGNEG